MILSALGDCDLRTGGDRVLDSTLCEVEIESPCRKSGVGVNRTLYVVLWVFEVLAIIAIVVAMVLPIQDYALREFFEWREHPSPETYRVFVEKQRQERAVRFVIVVPFLVTAVLLTGPLKKYRQKLR